MGGRSDPTVTVVTTSALLRAQKTATVIDNDLNGFPSPGDRIDYQVLLVNAGNAAVSGVVFNDEPDLNTALVVGSVVTTQGTVTSGNGMGDILVGVDVGSLAAGGSVAIDFSATIDLVLPDGVTLVSNQGLVSTTELSVPVVVTDDPTEPGPDDPTVTELGPAPVLHATKVAVLLVDTPPSGPSPGDTLLYQVVVTNTGYSAVTNAMLTDFPDSNTSLVVGSLVTSRGTIVDGNGGAPPVAVNFGTIAAGDSATVSFAVTIDSLPAGTTFVANQGTVSSAELPAVLTDDPKIPGSDDPTLTIVSAAVELFPIKTWFLAEDLAPFGVPSPGDTLLYRVTITNAGSSPSNDTLFNDLPDAPVPNTTLVVGSVQTSAGTVEHGNTAGDVSVSVQLGSIPANGGSVTITFRVTIDDPLPDAVTRVANQGTAGGPDAPTRPTDDPETPVHGDPTITQLAPSIAVTASKTAFLVVDADSNGVVSPGDTLLYQVSLRNAGTQGATGVTLVDFPCCVSQLVVGSVQTSAGTVTLGNSPGNTSVAVNVGTLPANGGTAAISFLVTIVDPLPAGVTTVSNQAQVTGTNFPATASDDPSTPPLDDPTVTAIIAQPGGSVYKTAILFDDVDGDGVPGPGDTLLYGFTFVNTGNAATPDGIVAVDVPDPNTTLVAGSVVVNSGVITSGNTPGDTSVSITLGPIQGRGGQFTASFLVTINDPLPPGTFQVLNQGQALLGGLLFAVTDDPSTPQVDDPTATLVIGAPLASGTKVASLYTDADGDGFPSAGDTLLYQVDFNNTGNEPIPGVSALDVIDPNLTLLVDSVQSNLGTITTPGGNTIVAEIGTIPPGAQGRSSFLATINDPLPPGTTYVSNQAQGFIFGEPAGVTNDPSTPYPDDPTVTQVTGAPVASATKVGRLFSDPDGNAVISPGDTVFYEFDFTNTGNTPIDGITAVDVPDPNTTLVVGSVQSSLGTITSGNTAGDTTVATDIGTIPAGVQVHANFLVTVNDPLPPGVTSVSNQAQGFIFGVFAGVSDDPSTPEPNDPTVLNVVIPTPLPSPTPTATPTVTATGTVTGTPTQTPTPGPAILQISKTSASHVAPGERAVFSITYGNVGGMPATGVVITETVPAHTTFSAVASTPGWSCPSGSPAGTECLLNVADLPPGTMRTVLFAARIDNPPGTTSIENTVLLSAAQGLAIGTDTITVSIPAPVPLLSLWAWAAALLSLAGVALIALRRRAPARPPRG